jgi:hypothetical protein
MTLVDVASDNTVRATKYANGTWASWAMLDAVARERKYLSGWSVLAADVAAAGGHAVIWTQPNSNGYEIAGMLVP